MLLKPFKGAALNTVTQGYHNQHRATDWVAKYGTPLVAPEDGEVVRLLGNQYTPGDDFPLKRGYAVEMKGVSGARHEYWHTLPFAPVSLGEQVKRGQIIAYMGNSGIVVSGGQLVPIDERNKPPYKGTHLHQNYIVNGEYLNPLEFIDLGEEPKYSIMDELKAASIVLGKMAKALIGK